MAGESITRDSALVRSCGLYFAPQRLHIGADMWGQYWQQRQAPAWLASLTTLKPETSVTVFSFIVVGAEIYLRQRAVVAQITIHATVLFAGADVNLVVRCVIDAIKVADLTAVRPATVRAVVGHGAAGTAGLLSAADSGYLALRDWQYPAG